jgi:uncharacterized protein YebE (UPF0316 family)
MMYDFNNFDYMAWILIPMLIFLARLVDVSLATLRHILVYKGLRKIVPFLAFIEVTIWLLAITRVMQDLSNPASFLAWAAGFAAGTYIGMLIEEKLALGYQLVRVISAGNTEELHAKISAERYGVTRVKATGARGAVDLLLVVFERKRLKHLLKLLSTLKPSPFYTIEDVRSVGISPWSGGMPEPTAQAFPLAPHAPEPSSGANPSATLATSPTR